MSGVPEDRAEAAPSAGVMWYRLLSSEKRLLLVGCVLIALSWTTWWIVRDHPPTRVELIDEEPLRAVLDINRATKNELLVLPGIGEKMAAAIVEERERGGPFRTLEEMDERIVRLPKAKLAEVKAFLNFGQENPLPTDQ